MSKHNQAVVKQSSDSHQTIVRQLSDRNQIVLNLYELSFILQLVGLTESLFSLVLKTPKAELEYVKC